MAALVLSLQALVKEQADALKVAQQRITTLEEEIALLKSGGTGSKPERQLPTFVKAEVKPTPPKLRQKRTQNFTHRRLTPTREIVHACSACPDCGGKLDGGWERSRRQIVDLPPIQPQVTDPVTVAHHCGRCGKTVTPGVDFTDEATGQQLFGHGVVSLAAYLDTVGRVPVQTICRLLAALLNVKVSAGQVVAMLHTVARQGKVTYDGLQKQVWDAPFIHADETNWRESGQSGCV